MKLLNISSHYDTMFFYFFLYLPCHDTFNYQKVKPVIFTKGLYYNDNMRTLVGGDNEKGRKREEELNPYSYKIVPWEIIKKK